MSVSRAFTFIFTGLNSALNPTVKDILIQVQIPKIQYNALVYICIKFYIMCYIQCHTND